MQPRRRAGPSNVVRVGLRLAMQSIASLPRLLAFFLLAGLAGTSFAAGNVVEYTYDAAGNIVQIQRQSASGLAITSFDPTSGPAGTAVTIYGSGFDPSPANNTVKFNGIAAAVSASTSGTISTAVPSGATTGSISVTVGAGTVTSSQAFVVTVPGAPTITSFTPTSGAAGVTVTVTGTNFDPAAGATALTLNGVSAAPNVASATSLSFTVPAAAASGRISVSTAAGTGTGAQDFIVAPPGMNASDIVASARIAADGSGANLAVTTPGASGVILFDGTTGGYYSLQLSNLATSPTTATVGYKVVTPANSVLVSGSLGATFTPSIHLPTLPTTGTYSLVLSPGIATLNTNVRLELNQVLAVDGAAIATSMDYASQSQRFLFNATAGQRVGVGLAGLAFTPATSGLTSYLHVYQPSGAEITLNSPCSSASTTNPQGNCDTEVLAPVDGIYTMIIQSPLAAFASGIVGLNSEVTGALTPDVAQDVILARVGQDGRFSIGANAGDSLAIDISASSALPQAQSIVATISKPDGATLASCNAVPGAAYYCELGVLPASGTYSIYLDPSYGAYGSFKLTLKHGATLATTDAPTAFAPANVPETARFVFSGTAGQNLSVGVTGLTYAGTSTSPTSLTVYRPDRSSLVTINCFTSLAAGSCRNRLANLPVTGTYSVVLAPPAGVKISGGINLSADLAGTLTAGVAQTIDASRAGQAARFTFAGNAGDSTSIEVFGISTAPTGQSLTATVYKPDGTTFASGTASATGPIALNFASLPTSGIYTVLLEPSYGLTWQAQLELDPGAAASIDGPLISLQTASPGEPMRYQFSGSAGQPLDIGVVGLAYNPAGSGSTSMNIYRPDGTWVTSISCWTSGAGACNRSIASLPATGNYSIVLQPPAANSIVGGTMALSTPVTGTLAAGGTAQSVSIGRPGQTARYTFAGTAGQLLRLTWTDAVVSGSGAVSVSVLKPDGSTLSSSSFANGAAGGLDIASLPTSSSYTVLFAPSLSSTMSASVSLITR